MLKKNARRIEFVEDIAIFIARYPESSAKRSGEYKLGRKYCKSCVIAIDSGRDERFEVRGPPAPGAAVNFFEADGCLRPK